MVTSRPTPLRRGADGHGPISPLGREEGVWLHTLVLLDWQGEGGHDLSSLGGWMGGWVAGWMDWWVDGWDGAMAICTSSQRGGVRGDHGLTPASSQRGDAMSTFSSLLP